MVVLSSVESEQRMVRRDCIIDIIKIMEVSSPTEKREHVKKIKKELEIKSVSTAPSVIMKQLTRMLKNLEREIRMANCFGKASTKACKEDKKMDTLTAKKITKVLLDEKHREEEVKRARQRVEEAKRRQQQEIEGKKIRQREDRRAKQREAKRRAAKMAQERAEKMKRQVEEKQLKKLQSLTFPPESDPVIYSKYDFLANLGLTMSMS